MDQEKNIFPEEAQAAPPEFYIRGSTLVKYNGSEKNAVIPDGVTEIGRSAFQGCSSLASVNIPDSVISISNNAFRDCASLRSVHIPAGVRVLEKDTFSGCTALASVTGCDGLYNFETALDTVFHDCKLSEQSIRGFRISRGQCTYCGGKTFRKQLFSYKCVQCGRKKDY